VRQTIHRFHEAELPFCLYFSNQASHRIGVRLEVFFIKRIIKQYCSAYTYAPSEAIEIDLGSFIGVVSINICNI
jgi:hypothetical protein